MKLQNFRDCGGPWRLLHLGFFTNHLKFNSIPALDHPQQKLQPITIRFFNVNCNLEVFVSLIYLLHCVKRVRIRSYSRFYFPAFGLNTERYSVSLRIESECVKIRIRVTPNTNTFNAVLCIRKVRF